MYVTEGVDNWKVTQFTCKKCAWSGKGAKLEHGEMFRECSELLCPKCQEVVSMLAFPIAAAISPTSGGSQTADQVEESKWLTSVDQLPEIDADYIVLLWDQDRDDLGLTILFGNQEIFRLPISYEYYEDFVDACRILKEKYGYRLLDVRPTPRAEVYLWGNRLGAPGVTDDMRELIGRDNQSHYPGESAKAIARKQEWKNYRK